MFHQVEEHTGDRFRNFVNQKIFGGMEALNHAAVLWINLPGVWGVGLLSVYAATYLGMGWIEYGVSRARERTGAHRGCGLWREYIPGCGPPSAYSCLRERWRY